MQPGSQVWLGHVPLGVTWEADGSQTVMATEVPAELKALIAQRQAVTAAPPATPTSSEPMPAEFAYRRQGSNDNGTLLLALRQDTFFNGGNVERFVRKGLHHDRALDQVFELGRLRSASQPEINATIQAMLTQLLPH